MIPPIQLVLLPLPPLLHFLPRLQVPPPAPARIVIITILISDLTARFPPSVLPVLEVAGVEVGADDSLVQLGAGDVAEGGEGVVVVKESASE